ncbi:unnamed protein product [Moneuplotes crassus]|uniref:Uncharacterized protein n=1 Tax=Euplotes crassus TaxID=5936 RepID=A0AAD1XXB6_EUPCR|nr:unnamed protein product [Moneuplotes crassus]
MEATLNSFIPEESLTQDLVYYTIGITGIRSLPKIPCKRGIQKEIAAFQECTYAFSRKKFEKALNSESLIILCNYITQKSEDPRISVLRDEVLGP